MLPDHVVTPDDSISPTAPLPQTIAGNYASWLNSIVLQQDDENRNKARLLFDCNDLSLTVVTIT